MNFKRKTMLGLLSVSLLAVSGIAQAQSSSSSTTRSVLAPVYDADVIGPYVTGQLGVSRITARNGIRDTPGVTRFDSSATAFRFAGGYQFNPYIATELGYSNLGTFDGSAFGKYGKVELESWDISLVGRYPFTDKFAARASIGVAFNNANGKQGFDSINEDKTQFVSGLGFDYKLNKQWAATADYRYYKNYANLDHNVNNFSVGLRYRF